ncbi:MAG: FecR family protein [Fimbriimonadaceae bacterium]
MRHFLAFLFAFTFAHSQGETLKFIGTYQHPRNDIEFRLNFEATRADSTANYTVAGVVRAKDGEYKVSGTLYAKSGKLRATVERKNAIPGKPMFEESLDGQLQTGGNKIIAKCILLSPETKAAMNVTFDAYKVIDTKETNAEIQAWIRERVAGSTSPDLAVDDLKGTATLRLRDSKGQLVNRTIKFTPLPPAFAFGGKWTFFLDATSIPKDERCNFTVSINFLDNTAKTPYIQFDLSKGERSFSKVITWNNDVENGSNGIAFSLNSAGPYVLYKLNKLKKSDFDQRTAAYNQTSGTGGKPTDTKPPTTTGTGTGKPADDKGTTTTGPVTLRTTGIKGDVDIKARQDVSWSDLTTRSILSPGTMINVGPESSATFQLPDGSVITVEAGTSLRIEELSSAGGQARALVRIMAGAVTFRHQNSLDAIRRSDFVIAAAETTASVRGTDFTFTFDPKQNTIRIDLREGKLEFDPGHGLSKMNLDAPTTITWKAGTTKLGPKN